MLRQRLSQALAIAAVKVAESKKPDEIKAQLKQRKQALITEVNGYRAAIANIIAPN